MGFGLQILEVKGKLATANINSDSSTWGNYSNVTRTITSVIKQSQSIDYGNTWTEITNGLQKAGKYCFINNGSIR